jgi:GNAT superfamily N-acetyltransferase
LALKSPQAASVTLTPQDRAHVTTVTTTYLEMTTPAELRPKRIADPRFRIEQVAPVDWRLNRHMYCAVGEPWQWLEKRAWTDGQWRDYAESDRLRTFVAYYDDSPAGYYELRRDDGGGIEIVYFGLLPQFVGKGFGSALLTSALEEAWRMAPSRVWLHTCSLDHPAALANYQARGMKIYRIETKERTITL